MCMAQGLGVTDREQLPVVAYVVLRTGNMCVWGCAYIEGPRVCWHPQEADREEQDRLRKRKLMHLGIGSNSVEELRSRQDQIGHVVIRVGI